MTATILAFPTALERDDLEFRRIGESNYTRAVDEARSLWRALSVPASPTKPGNRLATFANQVARLAEHRPEDLGDMVLMDDGSEIELRLVPALLAAMTSHRCA